MTKEEWTQAGFREGVYGDFVVKGFRYIGPLGEIGWHTTSWPNADPIHHFWIAGSVFRHIATNILDPQFGDRSSFVIGDIVEEINVAERQAVLNALMDWEKEQE